MPDQEIIPANAPHPGGRPLSYTKDIGDTICERLSLGESLIEICEDDTLPSHATVYRWLLREDLPELIEFRDNYTHARELQADYSNDEMKLIADDGRNDWMEVFGKDGESLGWKLNGEAVARSKLRWQDRQWRASVQRPKKYGPKLEVSSRVRSLSKKLSDDPIEAAKQYQDFIKGDE